MFGFELGTQFVSACRLYTRRRDSRNKLYALHGPEIECIAKGKSHMRYEFGVQESFAVTAREGLVVGRGSMQGNPYDSHTVDTALEQTRLLTDTTPQIEHANRGYKGVWRLSDSQSSPSARTVIEMSAQAKADSRTNDPVYEDGWNAGAELAVWRTGRRVPCSHVQRGPQPPNDPGYAGIFASGFAGGLGAIGRCFDSDHSVVARKTLCRID